MQHIQNWVAAEPEVSPPVCAIGWLISRPEIPVPPVPPLPLVRRLRGGVAGWFDIRLAVGVLFGCIRFANRAGCLRLAFGVTLIVEDCGPLNGLSVSLDSCGGFAGCARFRRLSFRVSFISVLTESKSEPWFAPFHSFSRISCS